MQLLLLILLFCVAVRTLLARVLPCNGILPGWSQVERSLPGVDIARPLDLSWTAAITTATAARVGLLIIIVIVTFERRRPSHRKVHSNQISCGVVLRAEAIRWPQRGLRQAIRSSSAAYALCWVPT